MSRTVTLDTLRLLARRLANVENNSNITDAELTVLANLHGPSVYDELVTASPPDYFAATTTITTSAGVSSYALQATFKDLLEVHVVEGSSTRRPLYPMPHGARGRLKAPTAESSVEIDYIPAAPLLVSGSDTIDGVSGYEELIAALMARDVMAKRQSDPSVVMAIIDGARRRIKVMARNRDKGQPKRIVDLDDAAGEWPWEAFRSSRLVCYRLRGDNIELYEPVAGFAP